MSCTPDIESRVRDIVRRELFDDCRHGCITIWGNVSQKRIGEMVAAALMANQIIVVDGRSIKTISGRKPGWR